MSKTKLILPTLRARMGDWIYYSSNVKFDEVSSRIEMADEIHKSTGLKTLIQREVKGRTKGIVEYLKTQEQRLFNSIIVGIYGGCPHYQEIIVENNNAFSELDKDYIGKTFGILVLNGDEKIFAIDGQHRVKAIKDALKDKPSLKSEEISVIFIAHKTDSEGMIRTRRLFSTLNRYAKPVNKSEIIAIDEEDNCAIITRNLVEDFSIFKDIIDFSKTRSISPKKVTYFTNIIVLYDIVKTLLTKQTICGIKVSGEDAATFLHRRVNDAILDKKQKYVENVFSELFDTIPSLKNFLENKVVKRDVNTTSLLFRPIGQNVFFTSLKIAIEKKKKKALLKYFAKESFNLKNVMWKKIFYDSETERLKTDKDLQRFASIIILKHIGVELELSGKDKDIFEEFKIDLSKI